VKENTNMAKMNEKSMTALRDEELGAVSGAKGRRFLMPVFAPYYPSVDNSKHVDQSITVTGNTFSEKGPGDLNVSIGGQTATL
jgi:hypothetical protein